jgi:hypothetical protein
MSARWDNWKYQYRLMQLWNGHGKVKKGIVQIGWSVVWFMLGCWLWETAVRLAHFQHPTKTVGVVLALISISIILWGLSGFGNATKSLGIRRMIITVMATYVALVTINVLTLPDTRPVGVRILTQLGTTLQQAGNTLSNWARSVAKAPDDFLFAYSGQRNLSSLPPGFLTPSPNATPVHVSAAEGGNMPVKIPTPRLDAAAIPGEAPGQNVLPNTGQSVLRVGDYARVVNTGGQSLRARLEPTTSSEIVVGFVEGSRLLILDGPVVNDGFTWWKVRSNDNREGWCADQWLEPSIDD